MKPIPKELQPYTDALRPYDGYDRDRPWWTLKSVGPGRDVELVWARTDGRTAKPIGYSTGVGTPPVDLPATDKAHPLPPPPILVGQVWALQVPGSPLRVGKVTHTWQDAIVTVGISGFGMNLRGDLLLEAGFLLSCPFGYAPWSGPEVAP